MKDFFKVIKEPMLKCREMRIQLSMPVIDPKALITEQILKGGYRNQQYLNT
jgi:hypothetical protein